MYVCVGVCVCVRERARVCVTATYQSAFLTVLLTRYVSGVGNLRGCIHLFVHTYPVGLLSSLLAQVHYPEPWGDVWEGIV